MSTDDGKRVMERVEAMQDRIEELQEALRELLPYAEACIGPSWRASPPVDSVITNARYVLAKGNGR